jgi:transposase
MRLGKRYRALAHAIEVFTEQETPVRLLRATHPKAERFVLYLDHARYYGAPVVKDWLCRHPEFELEPLPTYSPNLNLIERLWKFLRQRALSRWHKTLLC